MAEVKAQAIGGVEAALLGHVIAKRATQRLVQQVGGRVVGPDRAAAGVIDLQPRGLAADHRAFGHLGAVDEDASRLAGVGHAGHAGIGADPALIADLTATFGVERRLVHHDLHRLSGLGLPHGCSACDQRQHDASAVSVS